MKKNNQPILSICIPTWNRRYSLQYTLKSIMDQDEFKSGDVEIVISDNASTDETEIEVGKLCKKYKNIRYFRNKENIGGNPNINKVLSLGVGEYLRWIGSDSLILEGGLKKTLEIIQRKSPDIIYNNLCSLDEYNHLQVSYDKTLGIYFFENYEEYFIFLGDQYSYDKKSFSYIQHLLTFIGSICISKKFYNESLNKIILNYGEHRFNNNSFSHELICFYHEIGGGICIINKGYLDRFKEKRTTYFSNKKIVNDFKELLNFIVERYQINNKNFKRLKKHSLRFWYLWYFIGIFMKLLIKCKLFHVFVHFCRKFKYLENAEHIE